MLLYPYGSDTVKKEALKSTIYFCIERILKRENKEYATLKEIYAEVANYLEVENNYGLQSSIRGRLQENCSQYDHFLGENLFQTEKVRSGKWKILGVSEECNRYIRYKNNSFIVTNNCWQDLEIVSFISEDCVREENEDIIYQVKLRIELGEKKAVIILDELNMIRQLLFQMKNVDKIKDGYGTAFEVLAISSLHHVSYEECIKNYIVHGDADGKIDAIYYNDKNAYIYQIKTNFVDDNVLDLMKNNYYECVQGNVPDHGTDLAKFYKEHKAILQNKIPVYRIISNNSKKSLNILPKQIYQDFFAYHLIPDESNCLNLCILKPRVNLSSYNVSCAGDHNFLLFMSADKFIFCLLEALGVNPKHYDKEHLDISKYFYDNVRGVLKLNEKMANTIKHEPENFMKYNNGISITGEVIDLDHQIIIKNPVINNGQQTITTLIRLGENLDKVLLPIKITNEQDRVIKSKISQYSNEQVKVKAIDLLSLNSFVREIQKDIYENQELGFFLEIYSSGKKQYEMILSKLYEKDHIIGLLDFIKLYFSVLDKKKLGSWKNNPNAQVSELTIDIPFEKNLAFRVCSSICSYNQFIKTIKDKKDREDLHSADLAFKYLLCKEGLTVEDAYAVIKMIDKAYYYTLEKSKLIDVYKSSTIINKLEEQLAEFKKLKVNNKN